MEGAVRCKTRGEEKKRAGTVTLDQPAWVLFFIIMKLCGDMSLC